MMMKSMISYLKVLIFLFCDEINDDEMNDDEINDIILESFGISLLWNKLHHWFQLKREVC
jgi:hypothetical protein